MANPRYGKGIKILYGFCGIYTIVYYSKLIIDFNTMTSPLQKCIVDVIN